MEACWAHNPEAGGSKPLSANSFLFQNLAFHQKGVKKSSWKERQSTKTTSLKRMKEALLVLKVMICGKC